MEEIKKIREEMARILGLDASNEDVLNNIENENEHTISYQLDDFEIDRFQELRSRLKELELEERTIRQEMAKILGLDASNEDVLNNIENENEHTISYQLDDWEIDKFQELRERLKTISGKTTQQPDQTTKGGPTTGTAGRTTPQPGPATKGGPTTGTAGRTTPQPGPATKGGPTTGTVGQTTPQPGPATKGGPTTGTVGQTTPQPGSATKGGPTTGTAGQTTPQPGPATKGGSTTGTAGQTTPQPDPAPAGGNSTGTDGAVAGKDTPKPNDKDKTMKTANAPGFLIAVGSIIKAILDLIESLRGKVPQGSIRDKILSKIENGLKKVAGRPVAVNMPKAKEKAKTASNETQKIIKETREKKKANVQPKTQTTTETKTSPVSGKKATPSDRQKEIFTRDMRWVQSLINDNSADKKILQDALDAVSESMRNIMMNCPTDKQEQILKAKVRKNNVPHVGKTAYEDWLLYSTVKKLYSMAREHNISLKDEKTKELRPLEDVYKELLEKVNAKPARTTKTDNNKPMSRAELDMKWIIEQRDGPKGDRLFDEFEDAALEEVKPFTDSLPTEGEKDYDQKLEAWKNSLIQYKIKYNIPDVKNNFADIVGFTILGMIIERAEDEGIEMKNEKNRYRPIKDIYEELEKRKKQNQEKGKISPEIFEQVKWVCYNIVQAEDPTPFMVELCDYCQTSIEATYPGDKEIADILAKEGVPGFGETPRDTLMSYAVWSEIAQMTKKQGIAITCRDGGKVVPRPIKDVYKDLETKMGLVNKTNDVSKKAAEQREKGEENPEKGEVAVATQEEQQRLRS